MTQITNPEFESKHERGPGGKFAKMDREETEVAGLGDDKRRLDGGFAAEVFGPGADPSDAIFMMRESHVRYIDSGEVNYSWDNLSETELSKVPSDQISVAIAELSKDRDREKDIDATWDDVEQYSREIADRAIQREKDIIDIAGEPERFDEGTYYPGVRGSKSTGRYRTPAEIAKEVRSDIKEAYARGLLPEGTSCRVTKYGSGIQVDFSGLTDEEIYTNGTHLLRTNVVDGYRDTLNRIANAYGSSNSNPQIDYFNSHGTAMVRIMDENEARWREADRLVASARRSKDAQKIEQANQFYEEVMQKNREVNAKVDAEVRRFYGNRGR